MPLDDFSPLLKHVQNGGTLEEQAASRAFHAIMSGEVAEADIAEFLRALARRQPAVSEIIGATRAMRAHMRTVDAPPGAIDLCGTGGDSHGTLNVSTAVSFVVAGCGVPVAKHGNRSATSRAGAADVLEKLGVRIDLAPEAAATCLREVGVCFLFAQLYHPAMKHVANVRRQLGIRTIFNLLGPLSNPANVRRQLVGVYARGVLTPLAEVLKALGTEKAWIVHGNDGLDELTTTDFTDVAVLERGQIATKRIVPEDARLPRATLAQLRGGGPEDNAAAIHRVLDGEAGPFRDIVLLNAAGALIVADKVRDLHEGAKMAEEAIDSGAARSALDKLVQLSNRVAA